MENKFTSDFQPRRLLFDAPSSQRRKRERSPIMNGPCKRTRLNADSGGQSDESHTPESALRKDIFKCRRCEQAKEVVACLGPCDNFFSLSCLDDRFLCRVCNVKRVLFPPERKSMVNVDTESVSSAPRSRMQQNQVPAPVVPLKPKLATSAYPQQSLPPSMKSFSQQQQHQQHGNFIRQQQQQHCDPYYSCDSVLGSPDFSSNASGGATGHSHDLDDLPGISDINTAVIVRRKRRSADRVIMSQVHLLVETYRPGGSRRSLRVRRPPCRYQA